MDFSHFVVCRSSQLHVSFSDYWLCGFCYGFCRCIRRHLRVLHWLFHSLSVVAVSSAEACALDRAKSPFITIHIRLATPKMSASLPHRRLSHCGRGTRQHRARSPIRILHILLDLQMHFTKFILPYVVVLSSYRFVLSMYTGRYSLFMGGNVLLIQTV